jgi:hypothetical protein
VSQSGWRGKQKGGKRRTIMADYLKISYPYSLNISFSKGLKDSLTYIGRHYGKLANKEGYKGKKYLNSGIKFIAKRFGRFCGTPIRLMIEAKRIKNSNNKQWCYNKRIYGDAFGYIVELLRKRLPNDGVYVRELLNNLYRNICKESERGSELARLCSNALLFWQKEMLNLRQAGSNISDNDKGWAGKILRRIDEVDKPLPQIT